MATSARKVTRVALAIGAVVVACDTTTPSENGSVAVATVTQGLTQDPNGYFLSLNGQLGVPLRGSETTILDTIAAGTHSAHITGVAGNCTVNETNPRSITVVPGAVTDLSVTVSCIYTPGPRAASILFTRWQPDSTTLDADTFDLWAVAPDGSGLTPLVTGPGTEMNGSWSPDGTQILYEYRTSPGAVETAQIRVRDVDDSSDHVIGPGGDPAWSPDGTQIAYVNNGIYVMNADGSNPRKVSPGPPEAMDHASFPTWAPDGSRIAYVGPGGGIVVCRPDGTGVRSLTASSVLALRPRWSPDGTRLAFAIANSPGIAVLHTNGTGYGNQVNPGGTLASPTWSPDAAQLIFTASSGSERFLFRINVDGTGLAPVTTGTGRDISPNWGR